MSETVTVNYKWAEAQGKVYDVLTAWLNGREMSDNSVSSSEQAFVEEQWKNGGFDLIISYKAYQRIFHGL